MKNSPKTTDLEDWIVSTQEVRDALDAQARSPLPAGPEERHLDLEKSIQNSDTASRLAADAKTYLLQAKAQSVLKIRADYPELSVDERKIMAEASVSQVARLAEGCAICARTLKDRIYAVMNQSRAGS